MNTSSHLQGAILHTQTDRTKKKRAPMSLHQLDALVHQAYFAWDWASSVLLEQEKTKREGASMVVKNTETDRWKWMIRHQAAFRAATGETWTIRVAHGPDWRHDLEIHYIRHNPKGLEPMPITQEAKALDVLHPEWREGVR